MGRTQNKSVSRWIKIGVLVIVILCVKWAVDYLSIDGNPMDALAFKLRSRVSGDLYFTTIQPTSFQVHSFQKQQAFTINEQEFNVEMNAQSIRLSYFGDPVERAPLNRLLNAHYQDIEAHILSEIKADAKQAIRSKELALSTNRIPIQLTIKGEISYFSKSICSVRYRIEWVYAPLPDAIRNRRGGIVLDLLHHRRMPLKDILAYPYNASMVRLWDIIQAELEFSGKDPSLFNLYQNEPDFYLSPIGLVAINLSKGPEKTPHDIRIAYREYPALFRSQGNLKNLVANPKRP